MGMETKLAQTLIYLNYLNRGITMSFKPSPKLMEKYYNLFREILI